MLINVRSISGEYIEIDSLEEAIKHFISEDGYRISFILDSNTEVNIHRAEYELDHPSSGAFKTKSFGVNTDIAKAKVVVTTIKSLDNKPSLKVVN